MTTEPTFGHAGRPWSGDRRLVVVLATAMGASTVVLFAFAVLAPYLAADLGLSRTQLGLLSTTFFVAASVTAPHVGGFSDRAGPRRALRVLFGLVAGAAAAAAVARGVVWLLPVALVAGVANALGNPATNRIVADRIPPGARGAALGWKQAGVPAASFLAGAVLPRLADQWGWRSAMSTTAVVVLLAGLVLPTRLSTSWTASAAPAPVAAPQAPHRRDLGPLRGFTLLMGGASGIVNTYLALAAAQDLGFAPTTAGLLTAAMGLTAVPARVWWARRTERRDRRVLLWIVGLGAAASILLAVADVAGPVAAWAGAVLAGASVISWHGAVMVAVLLLAPPAAVGWASGHVLRPFFVGLLVTPVIGGAVADATGGFTLVWVLQGVLCGGALATVRRLAGSHRSPTAVWAAREVSA